MARVASNVSIPVHSHGQQQPSHQWATEPEFRSASPQPWQPDYLNYGVPVHRLPRQRLENLLKTLEVSRLVREVSRPAPRTGSTQAADESIIPAASEEVVLTQSSPGYPVAFASQVPLEVDLLAPSTRVHDVEVFSPADAQFSNEALFAHSPAAPQPVPEAQQLLVAEFLDTRNSLDLSLYENDLGPPEHQLTWSEHFLSGPQELSTPASSGTHLGKRRRDSQDCDINLGSLGNNDQVSSPAEERQPHDSGEGECEARAGDIPGSPSSSRREKTPRRRKNKVAKPRPKLQAANGTSWSPDSLGTTSFGASGPQDNTLDDKGPGGPTNGVYLGPARSISHWLQSAYRNSIDGPATLSPPNEGSASPGAKRKGKAKPTATGAGHFLRIPVNRLKHCLFCGDRSDTMTRHLETHRRHGGGDDGWVVTASNEGKFPSGRKLIEAVLLMCFATAKKGYGDPWSEEELAARHTFVEEFSSLDISAEENAKIANATIPEALKGRFVRWCERLSDVRKCQQCKKKFARADSYRRHVKKCGGPAGQKEKNQQEPSLASASALPGSLPTPVASSSSAPWHTPLPEPGPEQLWAAYFSMPELAPYEQPLEPAPPSPKRQRRF